MKCSLTFMVLSPGEKAIVTSTDTSPIAAGPILALQSHFHLLFQWTNLSWMDLPAHRTGKDYLKAAAEWTSTALLSVNCTCTLLGTLEELVSWAVCSLHPAGCSKASKHTLLSSDLFLVSVAPFPCPALSSRSLLIPVALLWGWQVSKTSFLHWPGS